MVERSRRSSGATIEACRAALERGVGVNLAGGTHHAFRDRGEGYCVFNDAAIAALAMQAEGRARRVVIIDCDVHQGNGTAAILAGDPTVFTLSIHGANNFPFRKEASDLDVELPDGTGDDDYLAALEPAVCHALSASQPDLAIYLSGADPHEGDRLGRLALTTRGLEVARPPRARIAARERCSRSHRDGGRLRRRHRRDRRHPSRHGARRARTARESLSSGVAFTQTRAIRALCACRFATTNVCRNINFLTPYHLLLELVFSSVTEHKILCCASIVGAATANNAQHVVPAARVFFATTARYRRPREQAREGTTNASGDDHPGQ